MYDTYLLTYLLQQRPLLPREVETSFRIVVWSHTRWELTTWADFQYASIDFWCQLVLALTKDHNRFATRVLPIVWSQPTNALLGVCSHYCCYIKMWNCNGTRKSRDNSLHRCRVYLRVVGARQTVAKFNSKFPLTSQPSFDCIAFKCNQHFYCKQETQLSQTRCAQHHIKHLQRTCTILMKCWF